MVKTAKTDFYFKKLIFIVFYNILLIQYQLYQYFTL
jgi:hypothetical protein